MASTRTGGRSAAVAYSHVGTWCTRDLNRQVHGVPLQNPNVHLLSVGQQTELLPACRALVGMWRLPEEKEIKVSEEDIQEALEEAKQEKREQVNAITSMCEDAAEALQPICEQIHALNPSYADDD